MPPILRNKKHSDASAFTPASLLREARRQKNIGAEDVPDFCILDPDGDIVRRLRSEERAELDSNWACYHTNLYRFTENSTTFGIIGCAVGAPFAVLVAEELFASGCRLLVSMTSAGQLDPALKPPCFVLIDRALRDEGTSYHYLPPADYSDADPALVAALQDAFSDVPVAVVTGATWTTDAPFRETRAAIEAMRTQGLMAVEMEAAALYAFARARQRPVLCLAHVTNQMGRIEGDFEKGEADGTRDALAVIMAAVARLRERDVIPAKPLVL